MYGNMSAIKKLILWRAIKGGEVVTVTGVPPLVLADALAKRIESLTQYGFCEQDGTPTPSDPVDIVCNNGKVVAHKPTDTYTSVDGRGTYVFPSETVTSRIYKALNVSDGKYTITVPAAYDFVVQYRYPSDQAQVPVDYGNFGAWSNGTEQVTLNKGARYGYGLALRSHSNPTSNIDTTDFTGSITVVHDDEPPALDVVGTPEVITIGEQTAFVEDLLAVGDVTDEQDIISGTVTRRVGVCVYDGTQTIGDVYLSTTGGKDVGAIIVYPLAEETTETVTAQHLHTSKGDNTISVTAEVSEITLSVQYKAQA